MKPPTEEETKEKIENYKYDQKLNYIDRNIDKYKRLALGSTDENNVEKYKKKIKDWQEYKKAFKENKNIKFDDIN